MNGTRVYVLRMAAGPVIRWGRSRFGTGADQEILDAVAGDGWAESAALEVWTRGCPDAVNRALPARLEVRLVPAYERTVERLLAEARRARRRAVWRRRLESRACQAACWIGALWVAAAALAWMARRISYGGL